MISQTSSRQIGMIVHTALTHAQVAAGEAAVLLSDECWAVLSAYLARRCRFAMEHLESARDGRPLPCHEAGDGAGSVDPTDGTEQYLRMLSQCWSVACAEMVCRLQSDLPFIAASMQEGAGLGRVISVKPGLGDSHEGGRSTTLFKFESGLRVVYKPRSVGLLRAWNALLVRTATLFGPGTMRVPSVLNYGTHGWVQWVDARPCASDEERLTLMRRLGVLAALAYVLGATDLHAENVVAHADSPVVIDGESLLWVEWLRSPSVDSTRAMAFDLLARDSVLRTGLLPQWRTIAGRVVDGSTFARMFSPHRPAEQIDALSNGFRFAYSYLASERGRESIAYFLSCASSQPTRAILRPTALYYQAMLRLLACAGKERNEGVHGRGSDRLLDVLDERERTALVQMDIPRFELAADRQNVLARRIDAERSRERFVWNRLDALSEEDLKQQIQLLRAAAWMHVDGGTRHRRGVVPKPLYDPTANGSSGIEAAIADPATTSSTARPSSTGYPLNGGMHVREVRVRARSSGTSVRRTDLLSTAERLADTILRGAVADGGGLLWCTQRPVGGVQWWRLEPADFGLYDGNVGIALFFSALARCASDGRWRKIAQAALDPVRSAIHYTGPGPTFVERFGVGGAEGLGGVTLGLSLIADTLQSDAPLKLAVEAIRLVPADPPSRSSELLYGASGWIAGLLAVYDRTGESDLLERAMVCAQDTVNRLEDVLPMPEPRLGKAGVAHGEAGVAAALAAVHLRRPDDSLSAWARRLWCFALQADEHHEEGSGKGERRSSWCTGAAGYSGVAALLEQHAHVESAAAGLIPDSKCGALIQRMVDVPPGREVSLCCGVAGRIDRLVEAAKQEHCNHADVKRAIRDGTEQLMHRLQNATLPGRLRRPERWPYAAGLYTGLAGIGYALLRAAVPDATPPATTWFTCPD